MQSLANQVSMEWNRPECEAELSGGAASENGVSRPGSINGVDISDVENGANGEHKKYLKLAVPARDFMVLRVPQHELTPAEIEDLQDAEKEIAHVMKSWAEDGGAYVEDPDGKRRWVGVEPEPKD